MTEFITSQNIGLYSRITLYIQSTILTVKQRKLSKCLTTFRPAFRSVCNLFDAPPLMSLAVKVPEIQNRWSYIRGCKTVNDTKVLKLSCYL